MSTRSASPVAWVILLTLRGLLLWIVIPLGTLAWLVSVAFTRRSLAVFLRWSDANMVSVLESTILRPLFPQPVRWFTLREAADVRYRVRASDLF